MNEFNKDTWQTDTYSVEYLPPDDIETVYDDVLSPESEALQSGDEVAHPQADTDISMDTETVISTEASMEFPIVIGEAENNPLAYWRSMNVALWLIVFILLFGFCWKLIMDGFRAMRRIGKGK